MVPLDRALVSSYRLSIVTMSLTAAVWPQFAGGIRRLTCIGSYVNKQVTTYMKCTTSKLLTCRVTYVGPIRSAFYVVSQSKIKQHKSVGVLIVCHFCRHCRDVTSDVCHGSTISLADCLTLETKPCPKKLANFIYRLDVGFSAAAWRMVMCMSAVQLVMMTAT